MFLGSTSKLLSSLYAALIGCSRRHSAPSGRYDWADPHIPTVAQWNVLLTPGLIRTTLRSFSQPVPNLQISNPFFLVTEYPLVVVAMDDRLATSTVHLH